MRPEVGSVCERPVAVWAREWLFSRMRPDVSLEQPRPGERFPADFAHARQRVSPDVHFERSQAHVLLLAVLAAEGFPRLVRVAVQLLVLEESRVRGVRLAAKGALELVRLHVEFGQLVFVAPRALRTAVVVLGRRGVREGGRVARDRGEVAGEGGQG